MSSIVRKILINSFPRFDRLNNIQAPTYAQILGAEVKKLKRKEEILQFTA